MNSELVIEVAKTEVTTALAEDHKLVELHREGRLSNAFAVGDIYLGRVKKKNAIWPRCPLPRIS